jgi:hypothetical protein
MLQPMSVQAPLQTQSSWSRNRRWIVVVGFIAAFIGLLVLVLALRGSPIKTTDFNKSGGVWWSHKLL